LEITEKFTIDKDVTAGAFGRELLDYTGVVFEYWHDYKAGQLSRETFVAWMAPAREQLQAALARAVAAGIKGLSGSCADILAHKEALWTFVERDDVEPTNNHAERELRAFVLWRKRSFGTQSQRGNLQSLRRAPDDGRPYRTQAEQERARVPDRLLSGRVELASAVVVRRRSRHGLMTARHAADVLAAMGK